MLVLIVWLFVGLGFAQETKPELRIPVGDNVRAYTFPKISDSLVEVRLTHCEANLSEMLDSVRRDHIRSISALNIGEASWLLRITLTKENLQVDANVSNGILELWVRKEENAQRGFQRSDTVTTQELLDEKFETGVRYEPNIKLKPLYGEALAFQMSPHEADSNMGMPNGVDGAVDWLDIDEARRNYLEAKEQGQKSVEQYGDAAYALGWGYLSQGFAQEAQYYFEQLKYTPGGVKPLNLYLSRARADLLTSKWDSARKNLQKAYFYGADDAIIVESMAYVSHATGIPNRAKTGRLLASLTSRPESLLLAGELLQMDGFYEESKEILEPLHLNRMFDDEESFVLKERLALRLGDAYLNESDLAKAREYWIGAPDNIADVRLIQAVMLEKGSNEWVRMVPRLRMIAANGEGQERAEALYLIGQVYSEYGTQADGIELWADFIQTFPDLAEKTNVIDLLWALYRDRIIFLSKDEKYMGVAQTHQIGWIPVLRSRLDDPDIVTLVSSAYEELGLSEQALRVLASDFGVGAQKSFYSPEAELFLAQLYFRSNRYYEALRTLELLGNKPYPKRMNADIRFLEADIFLAQGERERAKANLEYTSTVPKYRAESYVKLGILARESGDCAATISYLRPILLPLPDSVSQDPLAYLYLSQCLAQQGQKDLAKEVAAVLEEIAPSEDELLHARYLQANFGVAQEVTLDETDSTWNDLIEDLQEGESFDKEYSDWLQSKQ